MAQTKEQWLSGGKRYLKLAKGEKYDCVFVDSEFDPEGGMKKEGAMKYFLKDLKDGVTREMSSSSRALADQMSRLLKGDKISISVGTNSKGGKSFSVALLEKTAVDVSTDEDDEDEDEVEGKEVPF